MHCAGSHEKLYWLVVNGTSYNELYDLPGERHLSLRVVEYEMYRITQDGFVSFVKVDIRQQAQYRAGFSIIKTILICVFSVRMLPRRAHPLLQLAQKTYKRTVYAPFRKSAAFNPKSAGS